MGRREAKTGFPFKQPPSSSWKEEGGEGGEGGERGEGGEGAEGAPRPRALEKPAGSIFCKGGASSCHKNALKVELLESLFLAKLK